MNAPPKQEASRSRATIVHSGISPRRAPTRHPHGILSAHRPRCSRGLEFCASIAARAFRALPPRACRKAAGACCSVPAPIEVVATQARRQSLRVERAWLRHADMRARKTQRRRQHYRPFTSLGASRRRSWKKRLRGAVDPSAIWGASTWARWRGSRDHFRADDRRRDPIGCSRPDASGLSPPSPGADTGWYHTQLYERAAAHVVVLPRPGHAMIISPQAAYR